MNDVSRDTVALCHARHEQRAIKLLATGRLIDAKNIYHQLIEEGSNNHVVFGNLSAIYLYIGNYSQSEFFSKAALELNSDFPQAYHCLGNVFKKQGRFSEAIIAYRKALELDIDFAQVYNNLGTALKANGQVNAAINSYKKALSLQPNFLQAFHNLGIAYKHKGQFRESISYYKKALSLKYNFPQAHNNLGIALQANGQLSAAIGSYKKAVEFQPEFYQAHNNLGAALREKGHYSSSIECYKRALDVKPDYLLAYNNLGIAYKDIGNLQLAIHTHQKVLDIDPSNSNAFYRLGRIHRSLGDLKLAKQFLLKALESNSQHTDSLYILSTDIDNATEVTDLLDFSEYAKTSKMTIRERAMIEFCSANCFHWQKNYRKAAQHIAQANKLKLTYMPSNLQHRLNQASQLVASADLIQEGYNNDGHGRIFIVGVPRCGSTLLESILATNPNIADLGETDAMSKAIKRVNHQNPEIMSIRLTDSYSRELSSVARCAEFTVDKNLYNFQRVFHIARGMPAAKIIHCRRNPLDNILSMLRSNLRSGNNFTSDTLHAAKFIFHHDELLNHAKAIHPFQIFTFNYDEVAHSPEMAIKPLINWLGLSWSLDYLYPERNRRVVNTASAIQVRRPINNNSVSGWKNYTELLQPAVSFFKEKGLIFY